MRLWKRSVGVEAEDADTWTKSMMEDWERPKKRMLLSLIQRRSSELEAMAGDADSSLSWRSKDARMWMAARRKNA